MSDPINPDHYTAHPSGVEAITITRHESFLRGNVLKYVLRAPYKGNELQDMLKAQQYLAWEIQRLQERGGLARLDQWEIDLMNGVE